MANTNTTFTRLQTGDRVVNQLQDNIAKILTPILQSPVSNGGQILTEIDLVTGSNTINHKLDRILIGWFIVRQRSSATIYDTQDSNTQPAISLLLTSSANVTVDIYVF